MEEKRTCSLRTGLLYVILICWLVPMVIVMVLAGILFDRSYSRSMQQEI